MKIHIVTDNEIHSSGSAGNILEALTSIDGGDIGQSSWKDASLNISGDPEMLFLDIDSNSQDSWEKVTEVREAFPRTYTVLLADDDRFAVAAFGLHLDGYIVKPVTIEQVEDEIKNYRDVCRRRKNKAVMLAGSERANGTLTIRIGRNFECFAGGIPVLFRRRKTKELLRILAENPGTMISNDDLTYTLWGYNSRSNQSYLRTLKSELCSLLEEHGCADVLVKQRCGIGFFADPSIIVEEDIFTANQNVKTRLYSENRAQKQTVLHE